MSESKRMKLTYYTRKRKLSQDTKDEPKKVVEAPTKDGAVAKKVDEKKRRLSAELDGVPTKRKGSKDATKQVDEEVTKKIAETTARKRKERSESGEGESTSKKRLKDPLKRLTKNECICAPAQPDYSKDKDATITVEDWRLHSVQSPIALTHEDSNEYDHFEPLEFHGHWDDEGDATFTNNGYTATLTFQNRELPLLMGGPLHEDQFVFEQLHFHWSDDDHSGCEHIFEGKAHSMEAHAVHYNSKYGNFKEAVDKHDGLAVVAFFLQATDDFENPCFKKLSEAVRSIVKINSSTIVRPDGLTWIKDEAQCKGYYTYQGSLTTEPYNESVTWIIYPKPIHVSREQVQNFRNMKSTPCEKHNIINNVRPVQTPNKKLDVIFARSHKASA